MVYAHAFTWIVLLTDFLVTVVLAALDIEKGQALGHLLSRLLSIFVFLTGALMILDYGVHHHLWAVSFIQMIFGLIVIAAIDLIIVMTGKKRRTWFYWLMFAAGIVGTFWIGFSIV